MTHAKIFRRRFDDTREDRDQWRVQVEPAERLLVAADGGLNCK
jgi:hypothetical protein